MAPRFRGRGPETVCGAGGARQPPSAGLQLAVRLRFQRSLHPTEEAAGAEPWFGVWLCHPRVEQARAQEGAWFGYSVVALLWLPEDGHREDGLSCVPSCLPAQGPHPGTVQCPSSWERPRDGPESPSGLRGVCGGASAARGACRGLPGTRTGGHQVNSVLSLGVQRPSPLRTRRGQQGPYDNVGAAPPRGAPLAKELVGRRRL